MSTQTPAPPPSAESLARQLRVLKTLVAVLVLALAAGVGDWMYQRHLGQPVTILVNGKPIAAVRNAEAANRLIEAAEASAVGAAYAGQTPIRVQQITLERAPANAPLDPDSDIQQRLMHTLTLRVHAWVIVVNGHDSLGLPTQDAAEQTLDLVKQHFAQLPPDAPVVGVPQIMQKVKIVPRVIGLSRARPTPDAAAPYFWTPPPAKTYTVRPGDTGYKIALSHHIPFSDFLAANSSQNMNALQPGDVVNVQRMPLLLTVQVEKKLAATQRVLPSGPAADAGQQSVTYVVTYLDGQETARTVTNVAILQKPATATEL